MAVHWKIKEVQCVIATRKRNFLLTKMQKGGKVTLTTLSGVEIRAWLPLELLPTCGAGCHSPETWL